PVLVIGRGEAGKISRQAGGLEHVLAVGGVRAVGAHSYPKSLRKHGAHRCHPRSDAQVAHRIVYGSAASVGEAPDIVAVNPDRVRRAEILPQKSEVSEMRREALAVSLQAEHGLDFGFGEMGLQPDVEVTSEVSACDPEFIRAMERDGRRERRCNACAIEAPTLQNGSTSIDAGLVGGRNHPAQIDLELL